MHILPLVHAMALLTLANGSPVIAKLICGASYAWPIDGNARFVDGRPIFGSSKTIRGVAVSLATTAVGAWLLGVGPAVGLQMSIAAMAGDLLSSFTKRRLGLAPSSQAIGLDQIPESLFPLIACRSALSLSATDITVGCVLFFSGQLIFSRALYRLGLRERPY